MIKLFAILAVLSAAAPVSALAFPDPNVPVGAAHCDKDVVDQAYTAANTAPIKAPAADTAVIAN